MSIHRPPPPDIHPQERTMDPRLKLVNIHTTATMCRLATGWIVRGSHPGGVAGFSAPVQIGPGAHPASCTMGTGSFLGVKSGRGVTLTTHPLLVPQSRKSRAIPLLPLWAIQPVQSLSACTRVHFTFFTTMCKLSNPTITQPH